MVRAHHRTVASRMVLIAVVSSRAACGAIAAEPNSSAALATHDSTALPPLGATCPVGPTRVTLTLAFRSSSSAADKLLKGRKGRVLPIPKSGFTVDGVTARLVEGAAAAENDFQYCFGSLSAAHGRQPIVNATGTGAGYVLSTPEADGKKHLRVTVFQLRVEAAPESLTSEATTDREFMLARVSLDSATYLLAIRAPALDMSTQAGLEQYHRLNREFIADLQEHQGSDRHECLHLAHAPLPKPLARLSDSAPQ